MVVSGVLGGKNANDIYGENAESTYSDDEFYIDTKDGNKLKQAKKSDKEEKCYSTEAVKQFSVVGKYLIYCTDKEKIRSLCVMIWKPKKQEIGRKYTKVLCWTRDICTNGTQIVAISYDGKNIISKVKAAVMIKYKAKKIYFLKQKKRMDYLNLKKGKVIRYMNMILKPGKKARRM